MSTLQKCASCGAEIPSDAPNRLCPGCLLKRGLEKTSEAPFESSYAETVVGSGGVAGSTSSLATIRYFGDYQLLNEIARGGMGIVYKARQASLNRIVAVKMILAGQLASETDVQRFRTEAEAAANLQHPNIVAIHEIGQQDGQHYFSMDYIEGKNLAEVVRQAPMSAKGSAQLLKIMAEAIHYAHQRGTLHRDLKPQNVLIDGAGQPRITDFGLAKQIQRDSGLTQTGAVMGSPAYMSPEQATGRNDQVGPQSDVYSLGAILYEMLTGKPPFRGETPIATILKVVEDEPVAPSKLNPKTPPDLETICLKCLEKKPERRYASARTVAEELERFLSHEPIQARPASRTRKTWTWLRNHPWIITGAASLVALAFIGLTYGLWEQNHYLIWQKDHPGHVKLPGPRSGRMMIWMFLGIWALMIQLFMGLRFHSHLKKHRLTGCRVPPKFLIGYAVVGVVGMTYGVSFVLRSIAAYAWEGVILFPLPIAEGVQASYSSASFSGLDVIALWVSFSSFALVLSFVPLWWSTTIIWSVLRQFESPIFEPDGVQNAKILGFEEVQFDSKKSTYSGTLTIAASFFMVAGYLCLHSLDDQRWNYLAGGAIGGLFGFSAAFLLQKKMSAHRALQGITAITLSGIVFVLFLEVVFDFLPLQRTSLAPLGQCLVSSTLAGVFLAAALLRRRDQSGMKP